MFCPHCKDVSLAMTDRQGIEIDYCPSCRGIWLDRGELDRLIERAEREVAPPPPAPRMPGSRPGDARYYGDGGEGGEGGERGYGGHAGGHGTHRPRKKKSLLGELFDF